MLGKCLLTRVLNLCLYTHVKVTGQLVGVVYFLACGLQELN